MKIVLSVVILGAVAASIATAAPSGTIGYQWPQERHIRQVIGVQLGDGNFSPTVNVPSSDSPPVNAASSSSPSADVPSGDSPSVTSSGYEPSSPPSSLNVPTSGNPSTVVPSIETSSLDAPSSGNASANAPSGPFTSSNGPTCTMICQPQQQTVKSDDAVIGVSFGDRNFSPTLNIPSGSYTPVTVGSCACTPTMNMDNGTITCHTQQDQVEHPDRVVGVSIGDGNFSPTLNVPGSGPSTVTLFTCTCSCK